MVVVALAVVFGGLAGWLVIASLLGVLVGKAIRKANRYTPAPVPSQSRGRHCAEVDSLA